MANRILIVEDESVVAMDLEDGLTRLGYDVAGIAATAAEALKLAQATNPDLILMDVRLKGSDDGITAAQQIHALMPTPVIFLTANVDDATLKRAMTAEPYGYVAKPFNEAELHRAIELALNKRRAEEVHRAPFRIVVDAVKDFAIVLLDAQGNVVSWNSGAERMTGYESSEIIGRPVSVLYPAAALIERARSEGEAGDDAWLARKDGSRLWATIVVSAIRDGETLTGFAMIVRDISERRTRALMQAAIAKLSQSALASRVLDDLAREATSLITESLGVDHAAVLELSRDRGVFALRGAHEFEMASTREWQEGYTLDARTPVVVADYDDEHRFGRSPLVRAHDARSAASVLIRTDHDAYGALAAYHSAPRAFSEHDVNFLQSLANIFATAIRHQQGESALRDSERRFRAQYQRLPLSTFTFQRTGDALVLVDYNAAAERLTAGGLSALIGKPASEIFHNAPHVVEAMWRAAEEEKSLREMLRGFAIAHAPAAKDFDLTFSFVPPDFVLLYADDVTEVLTSREQLRSLSNRLISIQEEERKSIAREVHDEIGQGLTAIKLNVAAFAQSLSKAAQKKAVEDVARINALIDGSIRDVRRIASELRPTALDDFGLTAAVQLAAENFQSQTGIECEVSIRPDDVRPPATIAIVIYRILQEALTNVIRHAQASRVEVRVREDERSIVLEVRDNGRGVSDDELTRSDALGLIGMRERAAIIGGELRIEGVAGEGTIVSLRAPLGATS